MILLGLDSSAVTSSCAIIEKGESIRILAQASVNVKTTHSQTLLPLMESVMKVSGLSFTDIDAFAVSNGPGSFTGLRIGVSAVKGMAYASSISETKPVYGVSTLLSLAHNLIGQNVIACACMDARRGEVYNALFEINDRTVTRLTPDRAISATELEAELSQFKQEIICVGDGAHLINYPIAPEILLYQNAVSVCMAADESTTVEKLMPVYIRKPQAEREKESQKGDK